MLYEWRVEAWVLAEFGLPLESRMMRSTLMMMLTLGLMAGALFAQTPTPKKTAPATGPAAGPAAAPAAGPAVVAGATTLHLPPKMPAVAATVGKATISGDEINRMVRENAGRAQYALSRAKPTQRARYATVLQMRITQMPLQLCSEMIFQELLAGYLDANKIKCTSKDIQDVEKALAEKAKREGMPVAQLKKHAGLTARTIKNSARARRMQLDVTGNDKLVRFIRDHKNYFDGSKVGVRHILIRCSPVTGSLAQKAALAKGEKIAKTLRAKTVTFEKAAGQHSECDSKAKGGELPPFSFSQMTASFATAAFDAKVGSIVGPIRTKQGFHVLRVDQRMIGRRPVDSLDPQVRDIARQAILGLVEVAVLNEALTVPVKIYATPKPKPAPAQTSPPKKSKPPATKAKASRP